MPTRNPCTYPDSSYRDAIAHAADSASCATPYISRAVRNAREAAQAAAIRSSHRKWVI